MAWEAQNTKYGYMTMAVQSSPTVPVIPDHAVARVDGDVMKNTEIVKNSSIQNIYNNASAVVDGNTTIEWSFNFELSPIDSVWYLWAVLWSLTSTDISSLTDGSVYKHEITHGLCALPSYSIEQKTWGCGAGASQPDGQDTMITRAFGVKVDQTEISIEEGILKMSADVKAYGAFDVAFLKSNESVEWTAKTITAATWSAGIITFTTSTSHGYAVNDLIDVTTVVPTAYNASYKVLSTPTATTFTVARTTTPWSYTSWGSVIKLSMFAFGTWQIKWLVAWDEVRLYEKVGKTYENLTIKYVDEANDTLGFASVTSTAFTVANETKVELIQQTVSYNEPVLFGFKNVKVRVGDDISQAETNDAYDLSTMTLTLANNIETKFGTEYNTNKETWGDYTMDISLLFRDLEIRDLFRWRSEQAMIIEIDNGQIVSATDTNNQTYTILIKVYRFVYETREAPTASGGLVEENATGLILHDYNEGKSIDIEVYNNKAGTYYTA